MVSFILILLFIFSAVACHTIARRQGGKGIFWGVMGAVFGPLAIPFALLFSRRSGTPTRSQRS